MYAGCSHNRKEDYTTQHCRYIRGLNVWLIIQFNSELTISISYYSISDDQQSIMEHKVEKFQLSSSFTASTLPEDGSAWSTFNLNKPTNMSNKTTSQLEPLKKSSKPQNDMVSLDLSPDGSQLNITINGTTLNVTKNSCDITIGSFSIKLNSHFNRTPYPLSAIEPSTVSVVSVPLGTPLHIISTGDSPPQVTAALSLSKLK